MSFLGWYLGKADKEKKQLNLKAGLLILPDEICGPGAEPREAHGLLNQSNNLPMFYQQLSKQCFPGWKSAIPSQSNRCYLYPCKLLALLREDKTLQFPTFSFQPQEAIHPTLSMESKTMQRGPQLRQGYYCHFLGT